MRPRKVFREAVLPLDQLDLFPPSLRDYVPVTEACVLINEVVNRMDFSAMERQYPGGGAPSYSPRTMFKILILAMRLGIRSSRKIAQACRFDVRFMYVAEKATPDRSTISNFMLRHRESIKEMFVQTVQVCADMELLGRDVVSVDGTKIIANVSGRATYSTKRREQEQAALEAAAERVLAEMAATDAEEDKEFGDSDGDDLPPALADPEERKRRLDKAMEALKANQQRNTKAKEMLEETGAKTVGVTDLDSRVMKTRSGNRPSYNAQAAVDAKNHVIVAAEVCSDINDGRQFPIMVDQVIQNTGGAKHYNADTSYNTDDAHAYIERTGVDAYIPLSPAQVTLNNYNYDEENDALIGCTEETDGHNLRFFRQRTKYGKIWRIYRDPQANGKGKEIWITGKVSTRVNCLRDLAQKRKTQHGRAIYALRQHTVEPTFGHIKEEYQLRRFLTRGLDKVRAEFLLACCCHNIAKAMKTMQ